MNTFDHEPVHPAGAAPASPAATALRPVQPSERIDFLDTARGLALLGILMVNINSFGQAFGVFQQIKPEPGLLNAVLFDFGKVFCEGKFYTLFSLLFGIGLAIQWTRAHRAGRSFAATGLRRLFFLMGLGLAHGLLLWYGDILFLYSLAGLLLLPMLRCRASTQAITGLSLLVVASVLTAGLMALVDPGNTAQSSTAATAPAVVTTDSAPSSSTETATTPDEKTLPEAAESEPPKPDKPRPNSPLLRLFDSFDRGEAKGGPEDPVWIEQETRALKEGPWFEAFLFRAFMVAVVTAFVVLGLGWSIVAMFLLGAAMLKSGVVAAPAGPLIRKLFFIGLPIGLVGSAAIPFLLQTGELGLLKRVVVGLVMLPTSAVVALGYFSGVKLWVEGGRAPALARLLANVGRLGLTNYIMQTVICTFVFYHWGLARFGEFSHGERVLLALGVYAFQVVLSAVLVKVLAYGPLEWVWRSFTYLCPQPLLRRAAPPLRVAADDPDSPR